MEPLTLLDLNTMVRNQLRKSFSDSYWVQAEVSECKEHFSGHCYLELIQKRKESDAINAKARATIWSNVWLDLKPYFEEKTGTRLQAGQKILVEVTIEFHELYGYNLVVRNIDPTYTMGDLALRRNEVIRQLTADGVIDLNKDLLWPVLPQRLAIVSSPSAAGYEDFMHQLHQNDYGFVFYTAFFQATMQGEPAESSIIDALDRILDSGIAFDAVVIIRGGGASADLSCFDRYGLCYYCAQYPLPILSGIGHDRDLSVLDRVACVDVKTPTAAAEYILGNFSQEAYRLDANLNRFRQSVQALLESNKHQLQSHSERLRRTVSDRIHVSELLLERREAELKNKSMASLLERMQYVERSHSNLLHRTNARLEQLKHRREMLEKTLSGFSPEILIKRGFSLTLHNGKIVKSIQELIDGDELCTRLSDGMVYSKINKKKRHDD